jgi:hypothetical protein
MHSPYQSLSPELFSRDNLLRKGRNTPVVFEKCIVWQKQSVHRCQCRASHYRRNFCLAPITPGSVNSATAPPQEAVKGVVVVSYELHLRVINDAKIKLLIGFGFTTREDRSIFF